ncbi:MFS transporter [Bosea sp. (in: a-proteobacteria)]|jgi:MFS family permease|uniref:MFS transporter n=1 Tax=Bosea sp. (in: a-proteobacteria) TaxID=1871050 RepID=UPI002DDDAE1A|nr:MFS transporter [Bosea sp. (in: a-proteobacteria)]HEV2513001.1 MFS transporter [Bosea sp. (in: a-proteobacteria)]
MTAAAIAPAQPRSASMVRRAVISSVIGNGLEWYDFLVYGFFSTIIAQVFFPSADPLVSALLTAATFAISFLVRPVGGVLLSTYADRFGRKPILTVMILIMGFSTVLIGLTPSYQTIGMLAPILVIIARILQGVSVGAEFASATAMLVEYAPPRKKMLYGSFQMCSQALALALAAFSGYALSTAMTPESLQDWGWRIPFLLGSLITPLGFYIRRFVDESPEYEKDSGPKVRQTPFRTVLAQHRSALLRSCAIMIPGTASNYVWFIFLPGYVVRQLKLPFTSAMLSSLIGGILLFFFVPIMGQLADRWNPRRVWLCGMLAFALLSYPLLAYVVAVPSFERLLLVQAICALPIAAIWAPTPGLLAGMFPTTVRSTGMSIAYNMVVLLFGGLAPFTLTWLVAKTGSDMVPSYYLIACSCLALIALWQADRGEARR